MPIFFSKNRKTAKARLERLKAKGEIKSYSGLRLAKRQVKESRLKTWFVNWRV